MISLLITGGSGFLGKSILPLLESQFVIYTIGLGESDHQFVDLSKVVPKFSDKFDIILHAAGKAHSIPSNSAESQLFYEINLNGTKNLCKGLEENPPKAFIFISSVAVYGLESGTQIDESYPLLGDSPYALSKIQTEVFLTEWCKKHNVILSILRPSLIAGKNPPGNLGTMISGIKSGKYLRIGNGNARKSILMAEDIARILPRVANVGGVFNVCDNYHPSFYELEELISNQLGKMSPISVPIWFAKLFGKAGDILGKNAPINSDKLIKITQTLTFSNEKAKRELNWNPLNVLENFKIS